MRDQLLEHLRGAVRPLVEDLVEKVVAMVATNTAASWDAASSAALEQLRAALVPPVAQNATSPTKPVQSRRKPARRKAKRVAQKATGAAKVVQRDPKPSNSARRAKTPGVHGCSKCGKPGHNARSCGRAPNGRGGKPVASTPAVAPYVAAKAKVDRLAVLRGRQASRLPDPPIASVGEDELDEEELEDAIARAESSKRRGKMPRARSTFEVDRGEVVELDFGGGA